MSGTKWIHDSSTGTYHNVDYFMSLTVDELDMYHTDEKLYEISGERADGQVLSISARVNKPQDLQKLIAKAVGGVENG